MMNTKKSKILVLGASGMLGNAVLRYFSEVNNFESVGTIRSRTSLEQFPESMRSNLIPGIDVENLDGLISLFELVQPDVVINCIGLVKQIAEAEDPLLAIPINSLLPHRLAHLSNLAGARLIHISTDCVYSGGQGMYVESDPPDATDLYGRSKFLGEVDYPNAITLRTSIIGHELEGSRSLVNWFLSQEGSVCGYTKAIFSGLPTVEIARIIKEYVLPNPRLHGLYHLSSEPINKYDLLKMVGIKYSKNTKIIPDESVSIDRSLDSSKFRLETGYKPKSWTQLIVEMHQFK